MNMPSWTKIRAYRPNIVPLHSTLHDGNIDLDQFLHKKQMISE